MGLTYHGKSEDSCLWVLEKYKNNTKYFDNETVQQWVKECEEQLKLLTIT